MLTTALTTFAVTAVAIRMFAELLAMSRTGPREWVRLMIARWISSSSDGVLFSSCALEIIAGSSVPTIAPAWLPEAGCSLATGLTGEPPLEEPLNSPPGEVPRVAVLGCVDSRVANEFDPSVIDAPEKSADTDEDVIVAATSEVSGDSGEDVDLDELAPSVLDAVSAPDLLSVESPVVVSKTGDGLAEREPALLAGFDDAVEVAGCAPLSSAGAELVEDVPGDTSLAGLVVADGAFVWEPLETGEVVESDVVAPGGLDDDALAVFSGVLVAGSALAAVVAVGVCADGTGFVAVAVGVSPSMGSVAMGGSTVGVSAGAVGVDTGVSGVDPGTAPGVDVGAPAVDTGLSMTVASVDDGVADVDDGGSARIGISVGGSTVEGVDAVGTAVCCVTAGGGDPVAGDSVVVGVTVAGADVIGEAVTDGCVVVSVELVAGGVGVDVVSGDAAGVAVVVVSVAGGVVVGSSARIGTSLGKSALVGVGAAVVVG
ncbi:hypothetical protein V7S43_008727 [Phytophthora oleae]|uniref:Carbonic anhydrase n=1 Tax=Phytophthora oleae TaxID=2107226 RepID=A0ABD3FHT0_9STRA